MTRPTDEEIANALRERAMVAHNHSPNSDHLDAARGWKLWTFETCPAIACVDSRDMAAALREPKPDAKPGGADGCSHGWRGRAPRNGRQIQDKCPSCGGQVFIGDGGWLTCASVPSDRSYGCPEPGVWRAFEKQRASAIEAAGRESGEAWCRALGLPVDDYASVDVPRALKAALEAAREEGRDVGHAKAVAEFDVRLASAQDDNERLTCEVQEAAQRGYAAGVAEAVEMAVEMMDGIAQERVEFSDAYRRLVAQKADLDAVLARLRKGNADA